MSTTSEKGKQPFRSETRRLLELVIHSVYTKKEIFLRELISNASDALDKRYKLTKVPSEELAIRLVIDKNLRTLTISDNGIGMNREELEQDLGVIAFSGTEEFRKSHSADAPASKADADDSNDTGTSDDELSGLIGQFGIGFYSCFMVAERVSVTSRKEGEREAFRWESDGLTGYEIFPAVKESVGTDITLYLRKDPEPASESAPDKAPAADEYSRYLREYTLYKLVKTYSDYVRWPILLNMPHPVMKNKKGEVIDPNSAAAGNLKPDEVEWAEEWSWETLNSRKPLWARTKSEVKDEELQNFYREHFANGLFAGRVLSEDEQKPLRTIFYQAEGQITFRALLFIPMFQQSRSSEKPLRGLELYANGVKIMDDCREVLPTEFSFVRGVVDSPDLPLNLSRETVQNVQALSKISAALGRRIKRELTDVLKNDRLAYERFYAVFGRELKLSAMEDYGAKKDELGPLLLFETSTTEGLSTMDEIIERNRKDGMEEADQKLYYAKGRNREAILNLPQIAAWREEGREFLCFTDSVDEMLVQMFGVYHGWRFTSVQEAASEENAYTANSEEQEVVSFAREQLKDRVDEVILSPRLKSHPVCLSSGGGISFEMEGILQKMSSHPGVKAKRILELNPNHEAFKSLTEAIRTDPERAKLYVQVLYEQSRLMAGLSVEDPAAYTDLVVQLFRQGGKGR